MPVLQSYWLTCSNLYHNYKLWIFRSLCVAWWLLLLLIILQNKKKPNAEIIFNITEATRINEMAMILGLSLLTLGNFLGGVWANMRAGVDTGVGIARGELGR